MLDIGLYQVAIYFVILFLLSKPLGWYIARVYSGKSCGLNKILWPIELLIYRLANINTKQEMNWKQYLVSMLLFNFLSLLTVYAITRLQFFLPLNPQHFSSVRPDLAFNTAASFVTNTNWQAYAGESTMSYLSQMSALTVQNFLSAATGMALLMALIRGITRYETDFLGNFWVDCVRGILYVLLPLSLILSVALTSQGVIQTMQPYQPIATMEPSSHQPLLPMGPVASEVAIKQLGTNGGGFFNTNSAHPFENPTPISNFLEMLAILVIPAALCFTYGILVRDKRQGYAIFMAMLVILLPAVYGCITFEQQSNPAFATLNIEQHGNMEGKETRFGIINSATWATVTTATSNGSVNAMHDSFTPLGGLIPLWLMHLGEVIFGGAGSGMYGMLMLVIITVFIVGLMVGRSPEYLGKKIEPFEMKMASIAVLVMPMIVLVFTAIATITTLGTGSITNPGAHGFSELLYAFTSMVNNNGSAFAGLNANTPFFNIVGGIGILIGRYWLAIPALAIAGALARKKMIPTSLGTMPTHTFLFVILLVGVTLLLGALTFFPALALGPIVEHFMQGSQYAH
jgi:K+-transporting ATPase ATPase A chain